MKTIESFTLLEDRNIYSYVMEKHQRNAAANGKIASYMSQTYLYPSTFETTVYASQLLQARAIQYGVEHFRRHRGICMGTVVWQLNDCWPVASWSSIDYYGRWKALHYYERRFFAPVLLSCEEEGILTQDTNPNAEPYEVRKSVRFNVSNETMEEHTVDVIWQTRSSLGECREEKRETVTVPALSAVWLERDDMPDADLYDDHVSYRLEENGRVISSGSVLFCQPKYYRFADPELTARIEGDEIVVSASAYARDVEILNDAEDLVLSDNYFDMEPGEKIIKILRGRPDGLRLRSTFDIR
jgi:beta-mannosidase